MAAQQSGTGQSPSGTTRRGALTAGAAVAAGLLLTAAAPARGAARPQMRGLWAASVANTDWPSKPGLPAAQQRKELTDLLDLAVRNRLNAVFLQVRPTADAFWPSEYEPWSRYLTGTQGRDPGWDPLGTAVTEAHRRGLQLHAWCNPYRIGTDDRLSALAPAHPARRNPDWVVSHGGKLYYNPGLPEVREHVEQAVLDAVRRYPVDGVHFDDYFYPYPIKGQRFDDDAAYAAHGGGHDRGAWRRHNTDLLVSELHQRIRQLRPGVAFGVSPFGVWRNRATDPTGSATKAGVQAYDDLYADTRRWVREGWIDYIAPQLYWNIGFAAADYAVLVDWWARQVAGTGVRLYVGEAVYRAGAPGAAAAWQNPAELSRHLDLCERNPQVGGHLHYNATAVRRDRIGAFARLVKDHYPTPVPAS
ncbi:glycoside hydrolase family 10 protein [Streptomyces sp. NPDC092296]|uniref:glycoside hydrolase family 10 protein n=1 Tax=Streptomyces sp. NPDC092296 TaxID=3366012 RepID=UPI00381895C8